MVNSLEPEFNDRVTFDEIEKNIVRCPNQVAAGLMIQRVEDLWSTMKAFIMFLNKLPEHPKTYMHDIQVDINCLSQLYTIYKEGDEKKDNSRKNNKSN